MLFRAATLLSLVLVLSPAAWLLAGVVAKAAPNWQWNVLWTNLKGQEGGLLGPIIGTFILMAGVLVIAGSVGVLAGIHLAELARPRRDGSAGGTGLRMAADVLSGFPSIVLGYVGYVALVVGLHWGFSLLAAVIVLSLLVVPYVAKATETSLGRVATGYREGGQALGMSRIQVLGILLKAAAPGITTGLIIALAISVGETAPLLYTAGFSNSYPSAQLLHAPVPYLTYATWTFWEEPAQSVKQLAYDSSLILVVIVLLLILAARVVVRLSQRYAPDTGTVGRRRGRRGRAASGDLTTAASDTQGRP